MVYKAGRRLCAREPDQPINRYCGRNNTLPHLMFLSDRSSCTRSSWPAKRRRSTRYVSLRKTQLRHNPISMIDLLARSTEAVCYTTVNNICAILLLYNVERYNITLSPLSFKYKQYIPRTIQRKEDLIRESQTLPPPHHYELHYKCA